MRNLAWKTAAIGGVAALAVGGFASVAAAIPTLPDDANSASEPRFQAVDYVDGFEVYTDDWQDHEREIGVLSEDSDASDTVLLWQSVLAADGFLTADQLEEAQGVFGPETADATRAWEIAKGLDVIDSTVDNASWSRADDDLKWTSGELRYSPNDTPGHISLERADDDTGAYTFGSVTTAEGDTLTNVTGAPRIEHFSQSVGLE